MKTKNLNEKELVGLVKKGDAEAFHLVMEKYHPIIKYVCNKFRIQEQDFEDIKQEASLKIWEKREDLDVDLSFGSYLITIAKHLIYKKIKNQARLVFLEYYGNEQEVTIENTSEEVHYKDLEHQVNYIIENLPKKQGRIVKLKVLDNYSTDEISSKLKITKRATENHYYRGLEKVRSSLKKVMLLF